MAISRLDPNDVGSSGWWLARLTKQLHEQQQRVKLYDDYYSGRHRLAFATSKFREAFGDLFGAFSVNLCALIVDAVAERLTVEGFRLDSADADDDAWRMWQANQLDAESELAHREALVKGLAFATVWSWEAERRPWWLRTLRGFDIPKITYEDASEVVVDHDPGDRRVRRAALKMWDDDDKTTFATLYLPDRIEKWQRPRRTGVSLNTASMSGWMPREVDGESWPLPNPLGVVPVVPLANRSRLVAPPMSDLADIVPIQDAYNKVVADMIVASEFAAYPQRYAIGLELPGAEDGQQAPLIAAVSRLWEGKVPPDFDSSRMPAPQFGQFQAADLNNYVVAANMLLQVAAFVSRTPPHYFIGQPGQLPSGESIKSAETGLVKKAESRMRPLGEGHEETVRLGFAAVGDRGRAEVVNSETIWGDPETRTESEHVDALVKLRALEVPLQQLWQDKGYSPTQIARFREMRAEMALELSATFDPFATPETIAQRALASTQPDAGQVKAQADAMGALIRGGVKAESAARAVGLSGVEFIPGAVPVALRLPEEEAAQLEER